MMKVALPSFLIRLPSGATSVSRRFAPWSAKPSAKRSGPAPFPDARGHLLRLAARVGDLGGDEFGEGLLQGREAQVRGVERAAVLDEGAQALRQLGVIQARAGTGEEHDVVAGQAVAGAEV